MTTPSCKFKVGDAVIFQHKLFNSGTPIRGIIIGVEPPQFSKYFVTAELENGVGRAAFTGDGRFNLSEEPSLSLASEIVPCKFKVGDDVVFQWRKLNNGKPLKGKVTDVDFNSKYPVSVDLGPEWGLQCFKSDGVFIVGESPSLKLSTETSTMKKLTIEINGEDTDDLGIALEEITRLVAEDYLEGSDRNESGRYNFRITDERDIEQDARRHFEATRNAMGFTEPEWDDLAEMTRQVYINSVTESLHSVSAGENNDTTIRKRNSSVRQKE